MDFKERKHLIVYCSPAGTTRYVARAIRSELERMDITPRMLDLGEGGDNSMILEQVRDVNPILYIGSPVYVSHPVPPVINFINQLPNTGLSAAVPFVTWGGATSGIALYDMADALIKRGYRIIGAAKVLAVHSMMYGSDNPLSAGHPDEADNRMICELIRTLSRTVTADTVPEISLSTFAYQSETAHTGMAEMSLEKAKAHMPARTVDPDACSQCGVCSDVCPTDAIEYTPYPSFLDACICCYNCVRECPENAIHTDFSAVWGRIRQRAESFNEHPGTQIFTAADD